MVCPVRIELTLSAPEANALSTGPRAHVDNKNIIAHVSVVCPILLEGQEGILQDILCGFVIESRTENDMTGYNTVHRTRNNWTRSTQAEFSDARRRSEA